MAKGKKKQYLALKIIVVLFLVGLVIGAFVGNKYYSNFVLSNVDTDGKEVYLFIPRNATTAEVVDLLDSLHVLEDRASLEWMVEQKNYTGKNIVAGKYKIEDGLSNNSLVNHLRAGNGRLDVSITFNQVRDLKQLSGAMTKELMIDSAAVYAWLSNRDSIARYGFNQNTIISMFVPNTYYVDWDMTVPELMKRMGKEYKRFWNEERTAKLKRTKLTQSQVTTLASIVYWETKLPKDMKTIAGVYINRLRIGMPLQADPTLIFAMGDYGIKRVLNEHKLIDSPYNTYKYKGLPPGPVLIPPISYIDAVLDFEKHQYLYFVAKEDFSGESYFAKTHSQHVVYANRFRRELNRRKVYR